MDKKKNPEETIETPEVNPEETEAETLEVSPEIAAAFAEMNTQLEAAKKDLAETRDRYLRTAAE